MKKDLNQSLLDMLKYIRERNGKIFFSTSLHKESLVMIEIGTYRSCQLSFTEAFNIVKNKVEEISLKKKK